MGISSSCTPDSPSPGGRRINTKCGLTDTNAFYLNGTTIGTRLYGGVSVATLTVREVAP